MDGPLTLHDLASLSTGEIVRMAIGAVLILCICVFAWGVYRYRDDPGDKKP